MNLGRDHVCTLLHVPPYDTLLYSVYVYIVAVQQTNFETKRRSLRLFSTVVRVQKGINWVFKNRLFWGNLGLLKESNDANTSALPGEIETLYPCTRLQHSPRSFHTCTTTVDTHRELFWSLHFHYTTTWTRRPKWAPTTGWRLSIWHVDWVPTFYEGVTVGISLE